MVFNRVFNSSSSYIFGFYLLLLVPIQSNSDEPKKGMINIVADLLNRVESLENNQPAQNTDETLTYMPGWLMFPVNKHKRPMVYDIL